MAVRDGVLKIDEAISANILADSTTQIMLFIRIYNIHNTLYIT